MTQEVKPLSEDAINAWEQMGDINPPIIRGFIATIRQLQEAIAQTRREQIEKDASMADFRYGSDEPLEVGNRIAASIRSQLTPTGKDE